MTVPGAPVGGPTGAVPGGTNIGWPGGGCVNVAMVSISEREVQSKTVWRRVCLFAAARASAIRVYTSPPPGRINFMTLNVIHNSISKVAIDDVPL